MISISCIGCEKHCCGENPHLTPVLLPEETHLDAYSKEIKTTYGIIRVLDKKTNGNCIFIDDKTRLCTRYSERPLECQLYPLLLDFSDPNKPSFKVDKRYCQNRNTLDFDLKKVLEHLSHFKFNPQWIRAYESLEDV